MNTKDLHADYYQANIISVVDYYAFGMTMSSRSYASASYRYGMNTQEKVDEIASGHYTAENWEYDSRLGKRWNRDPKPDLSNSPYLCFENNPIGYSDINGDSAELIIGKAYIDAAGTEHPYGHAALRVFNATAGYNFVYDFGRYGEVDWNQTTGEGILNVYSDGKKYLQSEMKERSSVGYIIPTTTEQDKQLIENFNQQKNAGAKYKTGAVPGGGGTAFKLSDSYNIYNNNCLTKSCQALNILDKNILGDENDPREAFKILESQYKDRNLTRTEYNKGGEVKTTFKAVQPKQIIITKPAYNSAEPTDHPIILPLPTRR